MNKRKYKQLNCSKNGEDRNYLAKLLQQRTKELEFLRDGIFKFNIKVNNIKYFALNKNISDKAFRELILDMVK